jgi:Predicted Zn-dependent peptidases, insulinase-like
MEEGLDYTGALQILKVILSYDYLWQNIRVKGGAYGCMSNFNRIGDGYFVLIGIRIWKRPMKYTRELQNTSETLTSMTEI